MAYSGRGPSYRVVLLGESGVGKTSLFMRLKDNTFDENQAVSTGIDSCTKFVKVNNETVLLNVWDTAGEEKFRTVTRNYYRNAKATVFVYSLTDANSMHFLTQWIDDAQNYCPGAIRMLVGNKMDLERQVDEATVKEFADRCDFDNIKFISCKKNEGIQEAFQQLANELHNPQQRQLTSLPFTESVNPGRDYEDSNKGKKNCACLS